MISLEALLINGRESKSVNISKRVALIVGKDIKQKKWLSRQMRILYKIRSDIVHEGKNDLTQSDRNLLRMINYATIISTLTIYHKEKFVSISDLIKWCKCKKVS